MSGSPDADGREADRHAPRGSRVTESAPSGHADVAYEHVLVPLDGSDLARGAIPTAEALAARFGADLHTVSAADDARSADQLRQHGASVLRVGADDDHVRVVRGDAATVIVRRASELKSCLVCLSTHARGRLAGAFRGSVARSYSHGQANRSSPSDRLPPTAPVRHEVAETPSCAPHRRLRRRIRGVRGRASRRRGLGVRTRNDTHDPHRGRTRSASVRPGSGIDAEQ